MEIPSALLDQVRQGRAALFLGAGASKGAKNARGEEPPDGQQLGRILAQKFLAGKHADSPLTVISELAINEHDLVTVQEHIRSIFQEFRPAEFHRLIATFRWHGIATVNYDCIIEEAYEEQKDPVQQLVPVRCNKDRVSDLLKTENSVPLLKLHGCITRTSDAETPLILTADQYLAYRQGRDRLFEMAQDWGYNNPIVFVGTGLQDSDLRRVLQDLSSLGHSRPAYYLVSKSLSPEEERLWASRRIFTLPGTFEDFLTSLDALLQPRALRGVRTTETVHPIQHKFLRPGVVPSQTCLTFLQYDADYVHAGLPSSALRAEDFYRGLNLDWAAIQQDFDVPRRLADTILSEVVLAAETDRPSKTEFYVIKSEAGGGKTVVLHRVAWNAARDWEKLCLFIRPHGRLSYNAIAEIAQLSGERVFLFVDSAADNAAELQDVLAKAYRDKLAITVISAERLNEWNMGCERLDAYVTQAYPLHYLNEKEIQLLSEALERHDALGHLKGLTDKQRIEALSWRAGRQLLVALHEATQGKDFEEILVDEYREIKREAARLLYLSVCVLNRLDVPVRAGLIARVYQISFERFKEELFKPLEHVVHAAYDPVIRDYVFAARHPEIAEIVFKRILSTENDRFTHYVDLLGGLNVLYETDRQAYRRLIRGKSLVELFPNHETAVQIFKVASQISPEDPYFYHQHGIYEMSRANGNLNDAHDYLTLARSKTIRGDHTVTHSLAELARMRADRATVAYEKDRYRKEAVELASTILHPHDGSYGYHTLVKISLERLRESLAASTPSEQEISALTQEAERYLADALQKFPGDSFLLALESDLSHVLNDEGRGFETLKKAFAVNQRSPFIANRLARAYKARGEYQDGIRVLEQALEANRGDRMLHYSLAVMLIEGGRVQDIEGLLYHLKRSFTDGDKRFDAQFWYARWLFERGQRVEAMALFAKLRAAPLAHDLKTRIRTMDSSDGKPRTHSGRIYQLEPTYGFIDRDGTGDRIFLHLDHIRSETWSLLSTNMRVTFELGFNFGGPIAIEVRPRDSLAQQTGQTAEQKAW